MLFLFSVFNSSDRPWAAQFSELEHHDWRSNDFPSMLTRIARKQSHQLNICKSMDPDMLYPRVLKELADVTAESLSTIYQRL